MNDYQKILEIHAPVMKVHDAISSKIDAWWTTDVTHAEKLWDELLVRFNTEGALFMKMILEKQESHSIHWKVLDDRLIVDEKIVAGEWVGSTIKWKLSEKSNITILNFTHQGLIPELVCYDVCEDAWGYFLRSLKAYLETWKGTPVVVKNK